MSTKSERQAARDAVAAYHEAQLAVLIQRVGEAVDSFRVSKLDVFETDQIIFQYSRAAKELWKFCNLGDVVFTAHDITSVTSCSPHTTLVRGPPLDWWERGALNRR